MSGEYINWVKEFLDYEFANSEQKDMIVFPHMQYVNGRFTTWVDIKIDT